MIDIISTLQTIFVATIAYHVISSWGNILDNFLVEKLKLDRKNIHTSFILATLYTIIFIFILNFLKMEAHELFGLPEFIDQILTNTKEIVVKGIRSHKKL